MPVQSLGWQAYGQPPGLHPTPKAAGLTWGLCWFPGTITDSPLGINNSHTKCSCSTESSVGMAWHGLGVGQSPKTRSQAGGSPPPPLPELTTSQSDASFCTLRQPSRVRIPGGNIRGSGSQIPRSHRPGQLDTDWQSTPPIPQAHDSPQFQPSSTSWISPRGQTAWHSPPAAHGRWQQAQIMGIVPP